MHLCQQGQLWLQVPYHAWPGMLGYLFCFYLRALLLKRRPFRSQFLYPFTYNKATVTAKHLSARIISYHRTSAATRAAVTKHGNIFYHILTNLWLSYARLYKYFILIYKVYASLMLTIWIVHRGFRRLRLSTFGYFLLPDL